MNTQDNITTSEPTMAMYSELEHILMSGSLILIMMATLVGNGTVCLAVYRRHKLRTRTNMFIINLSCADIGVAVLCMPFSLVTCLRHGWVLGDALCKLNGFLNILFCLTSLLTLTAISVEKYFAICKPLYHRHMSRKFACCGLGFSQSLSLVYLSSASPSMNLNQVSLHGCLKQLSSICQINVIIHILLYHMNFSLLHSILTDSVLLDGE